MSEIRKIFEAELTESGHDDALKAFLAPREREVLDLITRGLKNDEVSERLYITFKTVRNHILSKLQVDNGARAGLFAREAGLDHHDLYE